MGWRGGRRYHQRNAKVDSNQRVIVDELNKVPGVSAVTIGRPVDILVGVNGIYYCDGRDRNFIFEIKNPEGKAERKRSQRSTLTEDQERFFEDWQGQVNIATNLHDVLDVIGVLLLEA